MLKLFETRTRAAAADRGNRMGVVASLLGVTICALAVGVQADTTTTRSWAATSGFHSFFARHIVRLTVVDTGTTTGTTRAIIELRDRRDRVVARRDAELTPLSPVSLDLKISDGAGLVQLRAFVLFSTDGDTLTAPLVTFEDIHPDLGLVIKLDPPCGPGSAPSDAQAQCPGWRNLTSPQE